MNCKPVSSQVIFKIALTTNLISVIWNIISDCDETYNYWEPLHFLIYGNGFQTWEYSPTYSLRSYLYLILYGWPAILLNWFISSISKRILFYTIRIYMAISASWLEVHLYKSLSSHFKMVEKSNASLYGMLILIFSTGSFISSTAFLPSSFALYCSIFTFSCWMRKNYNLMIASVALSTIIGWPFSAAIGIPFAIDLVFFQRKIVYFLKTSLFWGFVFTVGSVCVDSIFYGSLTFPSLNIVKYNVFNSHGSELYGVETVMFYVKNYLLNFNIAMILVLIYPLFVVQDLFSRKSVTNDSRIGKMGLSVFFVWNIIFFLQAHKEERFLFPCYPFLAIIAGLCLHRLELMTSTIFSYTQKYFHLIKMVPKNSLVVLFFFGFGMINLSRILAIILSFNSPVTLYSHLSDIPHSDGKVLCVGREWHRFPSNFLLTANLNVSFIQSDFRGQLPAKFESTNGMMASKVVHPHFNDLNEEETNRYVSLSQCDYIVDRLDPSAQSINEPNWLELNTSTWRTILSYKLLSPHSDRSSVFRSFYLPIFSNRSNTFIDYVVLEKVI